MENIIILVHLVVALAIIGLILLQQGKGAEMGASFGAGASQTLFGSAGSGNFFSRMTAVGATIFFVTSFSLAVIAKQQTEVQDDLGLPTLEKVDAPAVEESDVPVIEIEENSSGVDVPVIDSAESAEVDVPSDEDVPVVPEG